MTKRRKKRASNRKFNPITSILFVLAFAFWGIYQSSGGNLSTAVNSITSFNNSSSSSNSAKNTFTATSADTEYGGLSTSDYQKLANLDFQSGQKGYVVVNNNHSTLIKNAWKVNKVIYSNLDNLNRTSHSNTGFLEQRNVANDSLRVRQFVNPTAWHSNRSSGEQIYNRGHLIAYSVSAGIDQNGNYEPNNQSGDQNNPKNLFTQTAYSNQKVQTIFEGKVRQALRQGKKVIYQATPIFRNNELMARGINLQAVSTDGMLDFNVYIFNVQPGFQFNYQNGRASKDNSLQVAN
ncbi:DNA/RNA non-specific endonuclease [Lactobacillus mulieris]|jgi:DNA/RNA non-specific endonuclease|uniref:DNA/RNA non-specific endonuclease n=1 Tax=Lactobacillus mulieris TaxID=2508708 RepID=A0AAP3GVS8_9LACO|nr:MULTISPECIES: DNA/RNA non-specific endonuclease [Lactobacillus]EEU21047.1 hypothetical protein HMPREF0525_01083 [Lactobacillus jensenii 27-2-CHN]EEX23288.1 DNA/RNA non-specific endonuclease [Lactobacillus jensenii 115-3-CHN]EFH30400.1 DNA/RNA non-specific endonuclease [Lactobacillus jensenii JV-V16]KAA9245167.1 DNA/RNA non-specific endonuclease [Lactobacillus jensenii]KAA9367724.1 DNA/RNA non-specific endonuclease [Lactobacillus jensenii]